jgi:beta-N-acetylhexosaminidase
MHRTTLLSLPIDEKIGQLFVIGLPGPAVDEATLELLETVRPGGVCLFARNIRDAAQTRELNDAIREASNIKPIIALDQEGGLVDRLRRVLTPMPAADKIRTRDDAARLAGIIAEAVRILGFNMDFAPVVDVIDDRRSKATNGLHSRAFGSSEEEVTDLAGAFLAKLQDDGCLGCLKHFPGLGASEVDSHDELPLVNISGDEFNSVDLAPYRAIFASGNAYAVMVAHAAFPQLDLQETDRNGKLLPSSLSYKIVTTLLRNDLGFKGLALTDDLEMGAILKNYGIGEACKMAILAGQDMLAICADPANVLEGYRAVSDAVAAGEFTEERLNGSLERIANLKSRLTPPAEFDATRLGELSTEIAALKEQLN